MTQDIIKLSATFLGLDDVVTYLSITSDDSPSDEVAAKINQLIIFTNYIVREITREYYPLKHEETVTSSDEGVISFTSLSKSAVAIKDVKNCLGLSVKYSIYPEFINVDNANAKYNVFYNYAPEAIESIEDDIELPFGLDYFIVCYGIASEYALSKGLYEEANMWESKFINSLKNLNTRYTEKRFKCKRLK